METQVVIKKVCHERFDVSWNACSSRTWNNRCGFKLCDTSHTLDLYVFLISLRTHRLMPSRHYSRVDSPPITLRSEMFVPNKIVIALMSYTSVIPLYNIYFYIYVCYNRSLNKRKYAHYNILKIYIMREIS